jgi:hypothetical protein
VTDEEIRTKLGDAMDGLTNAWSAIEAILIELRDRELQADIAQHPSGWVGRVPFTNVDDSKDRFPAVLERHNERFGYTP